jgi:hypothetical protein
LKFSREAGDCARVDGKTITAKTARGTVANAGECDTICNHYHATCQGFSFESQFNTCYTFEDIADLKGNFASERVCHIRMKANDLVKFYGPDLPANVEAGQCVTKEGDLAPTYTKVSTGKTNKQCF